MAYEIRMPQLGLTMEEGTVTTWLKHEGDQVNVGDPILEITTDKLTNEVTSEAAGTLLKIVAQEGEDIPVKGLLGYIGAPGEAVGGAAAPAAGVAAPTYTVSVKKDWIFFTLCVTQVLLVRFMRSKQYLKALSLYFQTCII